MKLNCPMGGNPSKDCINIADYLDCECDYFPALNNPAPVFDAFKSAVIEGRKNRYTPVLVAVSDSLAEMLYLNADMDYDRIDAEKINREKIINFRKSLIENVSDDDAEDFLQNRIEELKEYSDEYNFETELAGEISGGEERNCCIIPLDLKCEKSVELLLAKIPVQNPWEIVAWIPMGGWNECPSPKQMIAIAKSWYKRYGAVICSVSGDEMEFIVENPLSDKNEAYALAKEHYYFCNDRLEQYTYDYNLGKLADCLTKSEIWYFWWD